MLLARCTVLLASAVACVGLATRAAPHRPRDSPPVCQFYDCPESTLPDPVTGAVDPLYITAVVSSDGIRYCQYSPYTGGSDAHWCEYDGIGVLLGSSRAVCAPHAICVPYFPCATYGYNCPAFSLGGHPLAGGNIVSIYGFTARICHYQDVHDCYYKLDNGELAQDDQYPNCFERATCVNPVRGRRGTDHSVEIREPVTLGVGLVQADVQEEMDIEDTHQPW